MKYKILINLFQVNKIDGFNIFEEMGWNIEIYFKYLDAVLKLRLFLRKMFYNAWDWRYIYWMTQRWMVNNMLIIVF